MFHRNNSVLRAGSGLAVPGATVTVYVTGTDTAGNYAAATKATIYSDKLGAHPIPGSVVTTDVNGEYNFYVPNGTYDEVVKYGSITRAETNLQWLNMAVGTVPPSSPSVGDLWVDTN